VVYLAYLLLNISKNSAKICTTILLLYMYHFCLYFIKVRVAEEKYIKLIQSCLHLPTGETVTRLGEEPVTRITRTQYTYNTPDKSTPAAVHYDNDRSDTPRKSSSSRRSSTGKTPSPERGYPDDDIKLSRILTSSVTSSNSFRRSEISDGTRKYDVSNTAIHDYASRRPKVTADKTTEGDEKFVSSATAFLSRGQKVTDESSGMRTSPERGHITNTDTETGQSYLRDGKYISSTTTRIRQMTPTSVRTDFEDKKKTSTSSYGKYSSTSVNRSEALKEVTNYSLDSERNRDSGKNRSLQSNYDDESDGYRYSARTANESSASSSRRYIACLSSL
jgi:hypothetical protein